MSFVYLRSDRFGRVPSLLLSFLAVVAVVAACKTTGPRTLSLEEARKVSASFEGGSFVPPPRTVTDVLASLRRDAAQAADRRAEWVRLASAEPPAGAGTSTLVDFYKRRAAARGSLGRTTEQIADLERLKELSEGRREDLATANWFLGIANVHVGNFRRGIEYRRTAVSMLDPQRSGPIMTRNSGLAIFLANIGDFAGAENALQRAQQREGEMNTWRDRTWVGSTRAMIRTGEANISMAQGRYAEAEQAIREAIAALERDIERGVDAEGSAVGTRLSETLRFMHASLQHLLAAALIRQGRLTEGEVAARKAVESAASYFGRLSIVTAEVMPVLGEALLEQGRAVDAEKINREAVTIYAEMGVPGDNLFYNRARASLAEALAAQSKWPEVLAIYRQIERDLTGDRELFESVFAADASWAMAEIITGDAGTTVARLNPALERLSRTLGDKHMVTAETRGLLAAALTARGDRTRALPLFEQSFLILSSNSRDSAEEGVTQAARNRRGAFILESYLEALAAGNRDDPGTLDKSMRVAGLAHGRSVQQAVLAAAARATVADPALADLVRREQDARKQIAALNGVLANIMMAPAGQRETSGEQQIREQISELRAARASLAREIETRYPDYAALTNPKPPGVAETQAALAPGEALVATYVGERASYVWAVPDSGRARFARVPRDRLAVHAAVARLRRALDPRAATLGDIPAFDVGLSNDLYRDFLAPVRGAWQGAEDLLVVADGPLGSLPMGVLVTERVSQPRERRLLFEGYAAVPWLSRDHAITVLPSVASLTALRSLPPGRPGRRPFVGFGDPVFRPGGTRVAAASNTVQARAGDTVLASRGLSLNLRSLPQTRSLSSARIDMLPPLPDTQEEIRSIALAMNADLTRDVFLGREASEQRVKTLDLSGYRVVAFATHGLVPGDLDGLTQPALALSNPAAAGGAGDGLLTMEEILSLRLDADWVVLSACNTGTARGAGAEAVSGLGRAFFYAGTRSLLVSNWPVETTSAKALTTDIFRRQAERPGLNRAAALREAMLGLMDGPGFVDTATNTTVFSYAHPIFWAPFSLIGDPAPPAGGA